MANTQAQFGLKHIGYLSGGAVDAQLSTALIQSTYATKIFFGDPVCKSAASGYIQLAANNTATALTGIFQGCVFTPTSGIQIPTWSPWFPGSVNADATAYIIDAPNAKFLAAALLTSFLGSAIGQNVGFTTGGLSGTTLGGGISIYTLDQSTLTTSNAWPFQVVGLYQGIGNGSDTTTNYNWVVVTFNNQRFKNLTGTN